MHAETGGKLRLSTHESQQSWPVLSCDSEQSRDWRKKSSLPVTLEGLLLIIRRSNMTPKMTVSQLQNSFWEWEKPVKRHYLTRGITSSSSDLGLLWTRRMVLQKYVSHRLWALKQSWVCTQRLMKSRYFFPESGDHLYLLICLMTRLKSNSHSSLS